MIYGFCGKQLSGHSVFEKSDAFEKVQIMDTTLRDGEQTHGVSFSPEEKLSIAQILLEGVKVDRIEIASARVSPGEARAVKKVAEWAAKKGFLEKVMVLGFVDGTRSVDWIFECGARAMNLLVKGSLKHLEKQLGKTPEQHIAEIRKTIGYAQSRSLKTSVILEDWSNGMRESREYVMRLLEAIVEMPVERICLADTLGVLTPDETKEFVTDIVKNFPEAYLEFHGHNDYGLAVANSLAAVNANCKGIHVTVNGLGERTGNAPLDEIAAVLNDMTPKGCNVNEKELIKASRVVEAFSGKRVSENKPIAGGNVFTQTAGIHADGDRKAGLYESMLRPERFGKERKYALGKLSGKASLEQNLERLGLGLGEEDKKLVLKRIVKLGDMKKIVTEEDLPYIVSDVLDKPGQNTFRIIKCNVNSGLGIKPEASITIKINGKEFSEKAFGDGGYDAFMNTMKIIAGKIKIQLPELNDYEVRIPPGGKTDALVETTIIWEKGAKTFSTMGVDSDQVMAAVKATEKMLNIIAREKSP